MRDTVLRKPVSCCLPPLHMCRPGSRFLRSFFFFGGLAGSSINSQPVVSPKSSHVRWQNWETLRRIHKRTAEAQTANDAKKFKLKARLWIFFSSTSPPIQRLHSPFLLTTSTGSWSIPLCKHFTTCMQVTLEQGLGTLLSAMHYR